MIVLEIDWAQLRKDLHRLEKDSVKGAKYFATGGAILLVAGVGSLLFSDAFFLPQSSPLDVFPEWTDYIVYLIYAAFLSYHLLGRYIVRESTRTTAGDKE